MDDHLHFAHYLDVLRSFKSYACEQNLISSTNYTVRTVVAVRGYSSYSLARHKDTVSVPMALSVPHCEVFRKCGHL